MPASEQKKLPGIFISYRRSDTPDAVGRIYDRLVSEFGKARVFKDVDSIPLGQDFRGHLNDIVGNCVAVLAVIGPKWTDIRNEAGQRRLEDPDDFVRIELEAALAREVPVVPVLVGHAAMPATGQLPGSLTTLAFRQAVDVRPDPDFHTDATRLVSALRQIIDPNTSREVKATPGMASHRGERRFAWMTALAAVATLASLAMVVPTLKHLEEVPPAETRLEITTPATDDPASFALSPDGRQIAFVANVEGTSRLMLRSFGTTSARSLSGTEGAYALFWSPNSRSLGFFANGLLKRLDLDGGVPQTLATVITGRGGTWNADGVILFSPNEVNSLKRVSAKGGDVTDVTTIAPGQLGHVSPQFLPDGTHFLYRVTGGADAGIYLGALSGSAPAQLTKAESSGVFHPGGWLLWVRSGALLAQRLDIEGAKLIGEPLSVADGFDNSFSLRPPASVSSNGWLAYRTGSASLRQLTWVDRSGAVVEKLGAPDATYSRPRISPDGSRVAIERSVRGKRDIWVLDGEGSSRFTLDGSVHMYPVWSPDGRYIAYRSNKAGLGDIYRKLANGSGEEESLAATDVLKNPTSWSRDGRYLMYFSVTTRTGTDIGIVQTNGDRTPKGLLATSKVEAMGAFSPSGDWFAYESDLSGSREVYVRQFNGIGKSDGVSAGQAWQVSTGGGMSPRWHPDGRELYFLDPAGAMMAATISVSGNSLLHGTPVRLFPTRILGGGMDAIASGQYDVAADGRFLINLMQDTETTPITLIQNWNPDAGK